MIQDPNDCDTVYLIEALLEACQNATHGGAMFAFASAAGAKLFLDDNAFRTFAESGPFDLVIGVDAITNTDALRVIADAATEATGLGARVFLHDRPGAIFHPKLCWFRNAEGGRLIVGSGNLTLGGLRGHWEAFDDDALDTNEAGEVESVWDNWTATNSSLLVPLDDTRVRARAERNGAWAPVGDNAIIIDREGATTGDNEQLDVVKAEDLVLIAEIPRGGDRWNQASFDLENYEGFFGAKRGTQRRMLFQHIDEAGAVGDLESRPSVEVRSRNFRFELDAAAGIPYPRRGRPVGVFVRVAGRSFRYCLLLPSSPMYATVQRFLDARWAGPSGRMRRVRARVDELKAAWPDSPLWTRSA